MRLTLSTSLLVTNVRKLALQLANTNFSLIDLSVVVSDSGEIFESELKWTCYKMHMLHTASSAPFLLFLMPAGAPTSLQEKLMNG